MKAKVIEQFFGAADGEIYPRTFKVGEIISGDLAKSEIEAGRAEAFDAKKPPTNKAIEPERNKHLSASPQGQASQSQTVKRSKGRRRK